MIECPICRDENWNFVRGKFVCAREKDHTPEMITNAVLRYENNMVTVKTKLSFIADACGPNAVYELNNRIVTKLYADGARFSIRLEDNAMMPEGKRQTLYINEVMVDSQHYATDRAVEAQFRILTGYSPEEFDGDLVERLSGGRLTASAHR
jgi:hypothetical protein